jgi:hypothetical protein
LSKSDDFFKKNSPTLYYDDFGSFCHSQKNPFNEWHWILFYHQVTKVHPLPPPPPSKKKVARFFYTCLSSEAKAKRKKASTEKTT